MRSTRLAAAMLVALVAACGGTPAPTAAPTAAAHTLTGTMELFDAKFPSTLGSCTGSGGYKDIGAGTEVVVHDQAGTILAKGTLGEGKLDSRQHCTFGFTVTGIPDATFYSIEVAHRGALTYSLAEMIAKNWTVGFTLGS